MLKSNRMVKILWWDVPSLPINEGLVRVTTITISIVKLGKFRIMMPTIVG